MEEFKDEYLFDAEWETDGYNRYIAACKAKGREPSKEKTEFVKEYATINPQTEQAEICYTKIDQFINESACNEEFNHIDYINEAWKRAGFETDVQEHKQIITKPIKRKTTKSVQEIISDFETLEPQSTFYFRTDKDEETLKKLKKTYPVLYKAYRMLSKKEIKSTNYNVNEIEKLLILKNNKDAECRVLKLLPLYFSVGGRYTKEDIKLILQKIYDDAGFQKKATAKQLSNMNWYDIKSCKIINKNGYSRNGFEILRTRFKLLASTK
jgi:hypothetical protein